MVFIDLKKLNTSPVGRYYNWSVERKQVSSRYINMIKHMHDKAVTRIKTTKSKTKSFPILWC